MRDSGPHMPRPPARAPPVTRPKSKPLVRKAGARQRLVLGERQVTFTWMVWYPVAPLGSVRCFTAVWV
jgi:hypothetical protein